MKSYLKKLKEELLSEYWTENLHYGLKEIEDIEAKEIVESMSYTDIHRKVNVKTHQQDYIADYLEYLWDISESSFWKHVEILFQDDEELLWSDNMFYFKKLCNEYIPSNILKEVILYIKDHKNNSQDIELLTDIIIHQVNNYQRLNEINNIISSFPENEINVMKRTITSILSSSTTYS